MTSSRLEALDVARGSALIGMVVYHFVWDLSFTGFLDRPIALEWPWLGLARLTAGSFLFIAGLSLALAAERGLDARRFLLRLAKIGAAALVITVATAIAVPGGMVVFGILHHILVASVLALPFLRAPPAATLLAALFVLALPLWARAPLFDAPWLVWTGLWTAPPASIDLVPLAPWFGVGLAGLALGRLALPRLPEGLRAWRPSAAPVRALALAGRHSLLVYLVHQPVLIGALLLAAKVTGVPEQRAEARFIARCVATCESFRGAEAICRPSCTCAAGRLRASGLIIGAARDDLSPADNARAEAEIRACLPGQ